VSPVARRVLPIAFAVVALAVLAVPASAATTRAFPTQSLADRGADVKAIQGLLRHRGYGVQVDAVFGVPTRDAVATFQSTQGLPADGIVREATWSKLIVGLVPGYRGEAVMAVQRLLNDKRSAGLPVDGVYGAATRAAVAEFQRHMGMTPDGRVGGVTWRNLLWHYQYPSFGFRFCDYSVGNGRANWGTGGAMGLLGAAAAVFSKTVPTRIAIGDVSLEHGGDIAGHDTHEVGLDVDVRPIRRDRHQCTVGTNWRLASYDRAATRALIKAIRATAPGHVKLIYFNDPVLIGEGVTTRFSGHDDHLHIRYCEVGYPVAAYRC
jgi:peptidoglycan hydrolase-like protein with peptidoglycan-binding domain